MLCDQDSFKLKRFEHLFRIHNKFSFDTLDTFFWLSSIWSYLFCMVRTMVLITIHFKIVEEKLLSAICWLLLSMFWKSQENSGYWLIRSCQWCLLPGTGRFKMLNDFVLYIMFRSPFISILVSRRCVLRAGVRRSFKKEYRGNFCDDPGKDSY